MSEDEPSKSRVKLDLCVGPGVLRRGRKRLKIERVGVRRVEGFHEGPVEATGVDRQRIAADDGMSRKEGGELCSKLLEVPGTGGMAREVSDGHLPEGCRADHPRERRKIVPEVREMADPELLSIDLELPRGIEPSLPRREEPTRSDDQIGTRFDAPISDDRVRDESLQNL